MEILLAMTQFNLKKTAGYDMRVMQFLLNNSDLMLYHNEPISKKWGNCRSFI